MSTWPSTQLRAVLNAHHPQPIFKDAVVANKGFTYKALNKNGHNFQTQKWAWSGEVPGSFLVMRLDTTVSNTSQPHVTLHLRHMRSFRPLGTATVECIKNCKCDRCIIDNHWSRPNTQNALSPIKVSACMPHTLFHWWSLTPSPHHSQVTQHKDCNIRVTINSPANKTDVATMLTGAILESLKLQSNIHDLGI